MVSFVEAESTTMKIVIIFCWVTSIILAGIFFFRALYKALNDESVRKNVINRISDKKNVTILFTLSDKSGQIIDSKYQEKPFSYLHGEGQILAGLEKRLSGLKAGSKKRIVVPVKEAYGEVNPADILEVEKEKVPEDAIKIGALVKEIGEGKKAGKILEVREKTLLIDYNHHLAGKKLIFDVTVLDVQEAEKAVIKTEKGEEIDNVVIEDERKIKEPPLKVSDGMIVTIEYAMIDAKGNEIKTEKDKTPITYTQGSKQSSEQILPGLQKRLIGLTAGVSTNIVVPMEETYGKIDPAAFQEVGKEEIFTDNLEVGVVLKDIGPEKKSARVHKVKESTVILDFNHPLAGRSLSYNVKILDIKRGDAVSPKTK